MDRVRHCKLPQVEEQGQTTSENQSNLYLLTQRCPRQLPYEFLHLWDECKCCNLKLPLCFDCQSIFNLEASELPLYTYYFLFLQFFDHPIIIGLLTDRWYGGRPDLKTSNLWWLFLSMWCLFDIVLFPVIFLSAFLLGNVTYYYNYYIYIGRIIRFTQTIDSR